MKKYVVDANVPIIANRQARPALSSSEAGCIEACVAMLERIMEREASLVIDDGGAIFGEYLDHLCLSGQPGVGDAFIRWVAEHQWKFPENRVAVIKTEDGHGYADFPSSPALKTFDKSDRKFVAVALAHPECPPICVAEDGGWHKHGGALAEAGVQIEFLCPELAQRSGERRTKQE